MKSCAPFLLVLLFSSHVQPTRYRSRLDQEADWEMGHVIFKMYLCTGKTSWIDRMELQPGEDPKLPVIIEAFKVMIPIECGAHQEDYDYHGLDQRLDKWFGERDSSTRRRIRECLGIEVVVAFRALFCCKEYSREVVRIIVSFLAEFSCAGDDVFCSFVRILKIAEARELLFDIVEKAELCECPKMYFIDKGEDKSLVKRQFDKKSLVHLAESFCYIRVKATLSVKNLGYSIFMKPGCCLVKF